MRKRNGKYDIYTPPKEILGQPWTYSEETKKKIKADKENASNREVNGLVSSALQEYQPEYKPQMRPKSNRPLQSVNGRRVMRTTANVIN